MMSYSIKFPAADPIFDGHFPGQPMVPGAVLLERLCRLFSQTTGQSPTGVKQVRFLAPIEPGYSLTVEWQEKGSQQFRFSCRSDDRVMVKGILMTGEPSISQAEFWGKGCLKESISTEELYRYLPHAGSMCLLGAVLGHCKQEVHCQVSPQQQSPLLVKGKLPTWMALEYAAQAFALHGVLNQESSSIGLQSAMVVSIKSMECFESFLPNQANTGLEVLARIIVAQGAAASYEFQLCCDDSLLASGQANVAYGKG